jgi:hypothetical protein
MAISTAWPALTATKYEPAPKGDTVTRAPARDGSGRFLTGNIGGGRPRGSRSKLTETFLATIARDFESNGADALEALRLEDPASYLRLVASLVPRGLVLQYERESVFGDLSISEAEEMLARLERHKSIERRVNAIKNTPQQV